MNIAAILRNQALSRPQAAAIIEQQRGRTRLLTLAGLEAAAARAATLLQRAGLRRGDVVLIVLPMSAELYIGLGAIFRLGLTAMFLDPSAGRAHIERCCAICPPRALIATPRAHLLRLISPALRRIPLKFAPGLPLPATRRWAAEREEPHSAILDLEPEAPALITFTSGSTGLAKAAVRSHGFLLAQHQALADTLQPAAGAVDLATMPIVALSNLASGVTSVIPDADLRRPGEIDPAPIVAQLQTHQASSSVASPALLERLASYCLEHEISLPHLRKVFSGGAPVFPPLLEQLQQVAPQAEITAVYGSTEAEPIAHIALHEIRPDDRQAMARGAGLLAGRPVGALRLSIIPDLWGQPIGPFSQAEFDRLRQPAYIPGEIVVSGEHVLQGYLGGHGDQESKFQVDALTWHRTGDAGYLDDEGRLWLLGRCAARISDARGILYPFAIECAVAGEPQVRRSALVAHRGRRILALETQSQVAREGSPLQRPLRERLAWAQIDEVRQYRQLPVDARHNAKIDYPALRSMLEHSEA